MYLQTLLTSAFDTENAFELQVKSREEFPLRIAEYNEARRAQSTDLSVHFEMRFLNLSSEVFDYYI
jgi:hypothetical protein